MQTCLQTISYNYLYISKPNIVSSVQSLYYIGRVLEGCVNNIVLFSDLWMPSEPLSNLSCGGDRSGCRSCNWCRVVKDIGFGIYMFTQCGIQTYSKISDYFSQGKLHCGSAQTNPNSSFE